MSYVSDSLKYLKDGRLVRTAELAKGIKCDRQQASVILTQGLRNGRIELRTGLPRNRHSIYAITEKGIQALSSGELRVRFRPTDKKPEPKLLPSISIGIVAHAMKTQPTSVWGLAA